MIVQHKRVTVKEFERFATLPENANRVFELIAGVIYELNTPSPLHNAIVSLVHGFIFIFLRTHAIGRVFGDRTGYTLDDENDFIPDVSYISFQRQPELPEQFMIAPDLAVEVVSPSNTADELQTKTRLYFEHGTRLVWIIYPTSRTVVVHTPSNISRTFTLADTLEGGDVLPGFSLPVNEIFPK